MKAKATRSTAPVEPHNPLKTHMGSGHMTTESAKISDALKFRHA